MENSINDKIKIISKLFNIINSFVILTDTFSTNNDDCSSDIMKIIKKIVIKTIKDVNNEGIIKLDKLTCKSVDKLNRIIKKNHNRNIKYNKLKKKIQIMENGEDSDSDSDSDSVADSDTNRDCT